MFNILLKVIFFIVTLLAICFILLFNGIKIDTLSFDDFKIKKLYLKYDKKLILDFDLASNYANLSLKTKILPTFNTQGYIGNIEEFELKFNKDIKPLLSKDVKAFIEKDTLVLKFKDATCNGVNLYDSELIVNESLLKLKMNSTDLITHNLLHILKVYDLDLPIKQTNGTNKIYTAIDIPLSDKPNKYDVKVDILNGDDLYYDYMNFSTKALHVKYNNDAILLDFDEATFRLPESDPNGSIFETLGIDYQYVKSTVKRGVFIYKAKNIGFSNLMLNTKSKDIFLDVNIDGSQVIFDKKGEKLSLNISNLDPKYINMIKGKTVLKDGKLQLYVGGKQDNLKGKVTFRKNTVQDVPVLNNLITFINTTPAIINPILALPTLFRLGETGFDTTGYFIKDGHIYFTYNHKADSLVLNEVVTKSKMMDFKGNGLIDLKTKKIKGTTDVIFMKDHSKFLNHIPVVGYVITGDDGNFVTQVDLYGSLDEPKFETHTVKNASEGFKNGLERIINLPLKLFDVNTSSDKSDDENILESIGSGVEKIINLPLKLLDMNNSDPENKKLHEQRVKEMFGD